MDLNVKLQWQHVVLLLAIFGVVCGNFLFLSAVMGSGPTLTPPWWAGVMIVGVSVLLAIWGIRSLLHSQAHLLLLQQVKKGLFQLDESWSSRVIGLNAVIAEHFGLAASEFKSPMPATFGELVAAVTEQSTAATITPEQYEAARATIAAVLGRKPESIPWSAATTELFPSGRRRYARWEQLRKMIPALPRATLKPWIENVAIYAIFAAIIAAAVLIARHYDADKPSHVEPSPFMLHIAREVVRVLFAALIAVLMIPVYLIGRHFACRLPESFRGLEAVAAMFPAGSNETDGWSPQLVALHLRDLVCAALKMIPTHLQNETPLDMPGGTRKRSTTPTTNTLERKLAALAEIGFSLNTPFGVAEVVAGWERESLDEPGFDLALICLGMEEEQPPWRPHCTTIWHFDSECIEGDGSYVRIAQRMADMAQGSLSIANIRDHIDTEAGTAWLEFDVNGRPMHINLTVEDDWVDPTLFGHFVDLLARTDPSKRYFFCDLGGQDCIIGCATMEQYDKLKKLIPKVCPLT